MDKQDHAKEIADLIQATIKDMHKRDKNVAPEDFLIELYNLVNSKIEVNLAVLGIITYGIMIVSADEHDYRLPKADSRRALGILRTILGNRSLGVLLAYQGHNDALFSPHTITKRNRPDNVFDVMVMPQEIDMIERIR